MNVDEHATGRSGFLRYATRRRGLLVVSLLLGFAAGVAYRAIFDAPETRSLANYVRSGVNGVGIGCAGWAVQTAFASGARSRVGAALRRLPLAGELVVRAVVFTTAFIAAGLFMELLLFPDLRHLDALTVDWLTVDLPRIVAIAFALSLLFGMVWETGRLIGGPLLTSVVLGTYHRPVRQELIVMFLDLADSTSLAEAMGELRVHDLITRFFFDIDEPIRAFGGAVHAYVGDEVIVSWPVSGDPARNGRCVGCFLAIDRKIASLESAYEAEFQLVPKFRAGLHAGPVIVSECGDAKRQLAYFGDTMNVAARLCEYCKAIDRRLVASADALKLMTVPAGLDVGEGKSIAARGRQEPVEVHVIEPRA